MPIDPITLPGEPTPVVPAEVPVTDLRGAGVNLAHWLLVIIATFVLLSVVWIAASEFIYFQWLYGQHQSDDTNAVVREHAALREFWTKISQMVLLNVLLPVLTAILGYTFGSRSDQT